MASIDEALATAEVIAPICVIDPDTRTINVPAEYQNFGVESDEKVTRVKFQCPKIVGDNIDLSEFNLYINYRNAMGEANAYLVDDVTVSGDNITFSWLLSRHVTEGGGNVSYIVCAKKSDGKNVTNEWNTKIASSIVGSGLEVTQEVEEQNADVIEQILKRLNSASGDGNSFIINYKENKIDKTWADIISAWESEKSLELIWVERGIKALLSWPNLDSYNNPTAFFFGITSTLNGNDFVPESPNLALRNYIKIDANGSTLYSGLLEMTSYDVKNMSPGKIPRLKSDYTFEFTDMPNINQIYWVNITDNDGTYTSDKTFDEISTAMLSGQLVCANVPSVGHGGRYFHGFVVAKGTTINLLQVVVPTKEGNWGFQCSSGTAWTQFDSKYFAAPYEQPLKAGTANKGTSNYFALADHVHPAELPMVTASDNGKLLGVTGGVWGKVNAPSGTGSDLSLGLTSATVGQIVKIKAIDENGKPTEWESAELPSFNGNKDWTLIRTVILTKSDETTFLLLNKDANGNTFAYDELYFCYKNGVGYNLNTSSTDSADAQLFVNADVARNDTQVHVAHYFVSNAQSGKSVWFLPINKEADNSTGVGNSFVLHPRGASMITGYGLQPGPKIGKYTSFGIQTSAPFCMVATFYLYGRNR